MVYGVKSVDCRRDEAISWFTREEGRSRLAQNRMNSLETLIWQVYNNKRFEQDPVLWLAVPEPRGLPHEFHQQ